MVDIRTTSARLINQNWSTRVPSPAYDSMSPAQRRILRLNNPWSFLNVTLSPEDVNSNKNISNQQLITLARESLDRILASGAFDENKQPRMYLYHLKTETHEQSSLVADIDLNDYENGQIKIHEQVRHKRAALLADHLFELGITSSPIALTYRNTETIDSLIGAIKARPADLHIPVQQGVSQYVWQITDQTTIDQFKRAFEDRSLYIIDGHHRAAASLATRSKENSPAANCLFGAMFPHNSLRLAGFNRWILDDGTLNRTTAIQSLLRDRRVQSIAGYTRPQPGQVIGYADKTWFEINFDNDSNNVASEDPGYFDSQLLFESIMRPYFQMTAADDNRINNVPGDQDFRELQGHVDEQGLAGFFLAPMSIESFMQAADQGVLLPPKSTYFTPKVQSGVFLRPLRELS